MPSAAENLLDRAPETVREELSAIPDLGARLSRIMREGSDAYPDLPLAEDAWVDHLAHHLVAGAVAPQLSSLRAGDVHLALACLHGSAYAHARLDVLLRGVAGQALTGIRLGSVSLDELLQDVRTKLLVGEAGVGKLASYSGKGPLEGWLRVTVMRAALSTLRIRGMPRLEESEAWSELASAEDPELSALRARCGPTLEKAIEASVLALDASDKALFFLHFVDGLTIDDLAVVYGVHRATVARRIARTRNHVFDDARVRAMEVLGIDESEFRSLMGVMMSVLDLTLRRILR